MLGTDEFGLVWVKQMWFFTAVLGLQSRPVFFSHAIRFLPIGLKSFLSLRVERPYQCPNTHQGTSSETGFRRREMNHSQSGKWTTEKFHAPS